MKQNYPFSNKIIYCLFIILFTSNAYSISCDDGVYIEGTGTLQSIADNTSGVGLVYITNPEITNCNPRGHFKESSVDICSNLNFHKKYSGFAIDRASLRNKLLIQETISNPHNRISFKACSDKIINNNLSIDSSSHNSWVEVDGSVIGYKH